MKKIILTSASLACFLFIGLTLSSNSNGPGGNRTGSPGSSGNCSGCHGGGNFSGQLKVGIVEVGDTNYITSYVPGKLYEMLVKVRGTSTKMGFQATAINTAGTSVGTLGTAPSGTNTYMSGSKTIWGHTTPSNTGTWRVQWTAPAAGTGNITLYSSCVLANSNNNDNGDQVVPASRTITETPSNGNIALQKEKITLMGNPVQGRLVLSEEVKAMSVLDMNGREVAFVTNSKTCDVSHLSVGTYFLKVATQSNTFESLIFNKL